MAESIKSRCRCVRRRLGASNSRLLSLVQEAVHQIKNVAGYKANAAVIKADDEMTEALLDIKV